MTRWRRIRVTVEAFDDVRQLHALTAEAERCDNGSATCTSTRGDVHWHRYREGAPIGSRPTDHALSMLRMVAANAITDAAWPVPSMPLEPLTHDAQHAATELVWGKEGWRDE